MAQRFLFSVHEHRLLGMVPSPDVPTSLTMAPETEHAFSAHNHVANTVHVTEERLRNYRSTVAATQERVVANSADLLRTEENYRQALGQRFGFIPGTPSANTFLLRFQNEPVFRREVFEFKAQWCRTENTRLRATAPAGTTILLRNPGQFDDANIGVHTEQSPYRVLTGPELAEMQAALTRYATQFGNRGFIITFDNAARTERVVRRNPQTGVMTDATAELDEFKRTFCATENTRMDRLNRPSLIARLFPGISGHPRVGIDSGGQMRTLQPVTSLSLGDTPVPTENPVPAPVPQTEERPPITLGRIAVRQNQEQQERYEDVSPELRAIYDGSELYGYDPAASFVGSVITAAEGDQGRPASGTDAHLGTLNALVTGHQVTEETHPTMPEGQGRKNIRELFANARANGTQATLLLRMNERLLHVQPTIDFRFAENPTGQLQLYRVANLPSTPAQTLQRHAQEVLRLGRTLDDENLGGNSEFTTALANLRAAYVPAALGRTGRIPGIQTFLDRMPDVRGRRLRDNGTRIVLAPLSP